MKEEKLNADLLDAEKVMFSDFMDWFNALQKGNSFDYKGLQNCLNEYGIKLRFKEDEPIPEEIQDDNAIICRDKKSKVRNLARHIRNAFTHSHISKEGGFFLMHDWWAGNKKLPARCTMRGKVSVDVMSKLLEAIKASRRIREANRQ